MNPINRLEEIFSNFPGIGPRQARRFVYYLLNKPQNSVKELTQLIEDVRRLSTECDQCHRVFLFKKPGDRSCNVCSDPNRDQTTLMILARDSDFESVEKSGVYKGLYFILGGTVPVLDKEPEKRIRLKSLLERVSAGNITCKEIILSLNTTPDGEHTTDIVKEALENLTRQSPDRIKVTVLGRGLSTGAELEYADSETIKNALQNRH